jgi:alpha-beta hydrolase superfamily lysophospholipase
MKGQLMNIKRLIVVTFFYSLISFSHNGSNTVLLFSHGIADTYKQAFWYAKSYKKNGVAHYNERYLFPCPWATFNYPDATEGPLRVNYKETSFGQINEMQRLNSAYNKTIKWAQKKWNEYNIILFGLSRGASNVGIFAGLHEIDHVKAIVLESPYYNMGEVIQSIMYKNRLGWLPLSYGETIAEFIFKQYNRNGMNPGNMVQGIPKNIPILIICSQEDQLVPYSSSINVYKKLIESGHQHTYILILNHGRHAKILFGLDGQKYQDVVHAFYKKYNLPHDPSIAANGEKYLSLCQPVL